MTREEAVAHLKDPTILTMSIEEVALLLGISRPHVYKTVRKENGLAGISIIRVGKRYLFPANEVRKLVGISVGLSQ